ncbi:MAG: LON peptidase substrate-binding domain-containing protein [Rubrivivax sp.]
MLSSDPQLDDSLPLFPLRSVLFPGGMLGLKVFEARYLDLITDCLRRQRPFGVVCLSHGSDVRAGQRDARFEATGVLAQLDDVDSEQAGLLRVRCTGTRRFRLQGKPQQQADGLWASAFVLLGDDPVQQPSAEMLPTVQALASAIASLKTQGSAPFYEPYRLDDAGWVANRWCEILPIALGAKQKLMELQEPEIRLQLVHEYLRGKGVVSD